jgi:hypothetical protein
MPLRYFSDRVVPFTFFVSGPFSHRQIVKDTIYVLKDAGHECAYDWTNHENLGKDYEGHPELSKQYAQAELQGIIEGCDVFIFFEMPDTGSGHTRYMELGAACASYKLTGKPKVYTVCKAFSPWMMNDDVIHRRDSMDQVIAEIVLDSLNFD